MLDAILDRSAIALLRVAPVVLRDELLLRAGDELARLSADRGAERRPLSAAVPRILDDDNASRSREMRCRMDRALYGSL